MRKPPFTGTLARTCARRPWLVVGVWVVLLALASVSATGLGEVLTAGEMEFVNRPESVQGAQLLEQRMRGPEPQGETVIVRSLDLTADDPGFRRVVDGVVGELTALEGSVESAVSYYQVHTFAPEAAGAMLSSDGHTVLVSVTLNGDDGSEMEAFHAVLDAPREQGFQVLSAGDETAEETFMSTAEEDLRVAEMYGLPITVGGPDRCLWSTGCGRVVTTPGTGGRGGGCGIGRADRQGVRSLLLRSQHDCHDRAGRRRGLCAVHHRALSGGAGSWRCAQGGHWAGRGHGEQSGAFLGRHGHVGPPWSFSHSHHHLSQPGSRSVAGCGCSGSSHADFGAGLIEPLG